MSKELDEKIAAIRAKQEAEVKKVEKVHSEPEISEEDLKIQERPLDWKQAEKRFEEVEKYQMTFNGKPGFNPFIWLRDNVLPLRTQYKNGIRSAELYNKIMSLTFIEPDGVALNASAAYRLSDVLTEGGKLNLPKK